MYCSNCGNAVTENAAVCVRCGFRVNTGNRFCANCGRPATPGASICTNCGSILAVFLARNAKSRIAAGIFGLLFGSLGVHNFYLGYTGKAVAQLLITLLTCGAGSIISTIWGFIEGVLILAGSINEDGDGIPLKD